MCIWEVVFRLNFHESRQRVCCAGGWLIFRRRSIAKYDQLFLLKTFLLLAYLRAILPGGSVVKV